MADNENAKYKTIKSNLSSFYVAKGIAMPDTDSPTFKEQVMAKLNDTISNQSEILNNLSTHTIDINTINKKISEQASEENKLITESEVNAKIGRSEATALFKGANGENFFTKEELDNATTFYTIKGEEKTADINDTTYILADETHGDLGAKYLFNGEEWVLEAVLGEINVVEITATLTMAVECLNESWYNPEEYITAQSTYKTFENVNVSMYNQQRLRLKNSICKLTLTVINPDSDRGLPTTKTYFLKQYNFKEYTGNTFRINFYEVFPYVNSDSHYYYLSMLAYISKDETDKEYFALRGCFAPRHYFIDFSTTNRYEFLGLIKSDTLTDYTFQLQHQDDGKLVSFSKGTLQVGEKIVLKWGRSQKTLFDDFYEFSPIRATITAIDYATSTITIDTLIDQNIIQKGVIVCKDTESERTILKLKTIEELEYAVLETPNYYITRASITENGLTLTTQDKEEIVFSEQAKITAEAEARAKADETLQNNINACVHSSALSLTDTDYKLTLETKNASGEVISSSTVDFPLEIMVVNGEYDDDTNSIIITLQNKNEISIPLGALIKGLATTSYVDEKDKELQDKITAETTARETADNKLQTAIDNLTTSSITQSYVDEKVGTLQTNINTETGTRTSADNHLQSQITTLNTALADNINALNTSLTTINTNLIGEITARETKDKSLESSFNQLYNSLYITGSTDFKLLFNILMPIGFIFEICDSTYTTETMTERYGGSWEEITGFTFGAGTITETSGTFTFNVGDTGGEVKHKLTKQEMPAHNHKVMNYDENDTGSGATAKIFDAIWTNKRQGYLNCVETVGGDTAHNNMPPYLVVRKFKRTALFEEE